MAEKDTNIYLVRATGRDYLVEARNKVAALNFIVQTTHTVSLATQKELVDLIKAGVEVETAFQLPLDLAPD